MTKRLLLTAALGACAAGPASAGLLPGVVTRTPDGADTRFTYAVVLPTDSQLRVGRDNQFTIYDFAGYVKGSEKAPDGWAFKLANVGPTPVETDPVDDPAVPNLSWTYVGPGLVGQQGVGNFWADSVYFDATPAYFTARTLTDNNRVDTNITTTLVPVGTSVGPGPTVPEPGTLLLAAAGLPLARLVGRRRSRT